MITIYFDGRIEPNPGGIATYGFIITHNGKEIKRGCGVIGSGPGMTNNLAEYTALREALRWLGTKYPREGILAKGDSKLVINQMKGEWKIKSETSKKFVPIIQKLIKKRSVRFEWVPRYLNTEPDLLSNLAYRKYQEDSRFTNLSSTQTQLF